MLYDANGRYMAFGETDSVFTFNAGVESALPNWLTTEGDSPILTFQPVGAGSRGTVTVQTKSATPANGDIAGLQTMAIDTNQYSEIGFFLNGLNVDSGASPTNVALQLITGDSSTNGLTYQSNSSGAGAMQHVIHNASAVNTTLQYMNSANIGKRKNLGFVIRPKSGEVFFTTGDPAEGAAVVAYARGYAASVLTFRTHVVTKGAAQRSMSLSRLRLRLHQY